MKQWIVPALIVVALAGPVIDDVYELVRDRGSAAVPLDVNLLDSGVLRFDSRDLEIDLRAGRAAEGDDPSTPTFSLGQEWSPPGVSGVWTLRDRATLDLRLVNGGQRSLMLQCRPDRRRKPPPVLTVTANGIDCGSVQLTRVLSVVRLELPDRVIASGDNRLEFELKSPFQPAQPASRRTLFVRRLVLAEATDADFEEIISRLPPVLRTSGDAVRVQAPGTLFLEFDAPRPGGVVSFQCGFRRAVKGAGCDVVVGRWFPDSHALDIVGAVRVSGERVRARGYRIALGNHAGPSLLRITVDGASAEAGVELRSPRLVADST